MRSLFFGLVPENSSRQDLTGTSLSEVSPGALRRDARPACFIVAFDHPAGGADQKRVALSYLRQPLHTKVRLQLILFPMV